MKCYDFMKFKKFKRFRIEDIRKQYGIDFQKIQKEKGRQFVIEYLQEKIEYSNWGEKLVPEKFMTGNFRKYEKERLENMLVKLRELLENELSYSADLCSMIHMAAIYGAKENVSVTDEMKTVWESNSNKNRADGANNGATYKINKATVREYYPIEGAFFSKKEDVKSYLAKVNEGYMDFHKLMINKSNIGIFDITTQIQDYKRYSVMRTHIIYNELKSSSIENLLLMEYALGIGYANQAYSYMKEITSMELLKKYLCIVKKGAEIPTFFIRKRIMEIIWGYIGGNTENRIQSSEKILDTVQKELKVIFESTVELFWYTFCYFLTADNAYRIMLTAKTAWENYFLEKAYLDFIDAEGISDWDLVKSAEDCFVYIENFRYSEAQYSNYLLGGINWGKDRFLAIIDCTGHKETLHIEEPINDIGIKILEEVEKQIRNKKLSKEPLDIYKMYYEEREEAYKRIFEREQKKLYGKDIKIRDTMRKITPFHTYAILQREIIKVLLTES